MSEELKCQADDTARGGGSSPSALQFDLIAEALDCMEQLEVLGPSSGYCWLNLRPDHKAAKGLVSIRLGGDPDGIDETSDAMRDAYLHWFRKLKAVREKLQAQRPTEEPSGDERPLQAQHQPDIEKARAIVAATTDELLGITDKGPFHLAYYIPSLSKFVAAIATALRAEREIIAKAADARADVLSDWGDMNGARALAAFAASIRTGDTHD